MHGIETSFRSMADVLPVMLWADAADGRSTFFNRRWLDFTGHTIEDELANGWTADIHPADFVRCTAAYENSFKHRQEFSCECRLCRADGTYLWMLANATPCFSSGPVFEGYIGVCTEISNIRMVRRQTLRQRKLETIGALAGGIAHDFNNLLGSIIADAELALHNPVPSRFSEGMERIRRVAVRAAEIVRELLVYTGQDEGQVTPVDVSSLVEEMLALLRVSICKNARIITDLALHPPAVFGEAAELRQVVMNLILNASDALRGSGGDIFVATSRTVISEAGPVLQVPPGEYIRLEIADTGHGMPAEVQARIFDPSFSTKPNGRGLGLSVVKGIVQRYGGYIQCNSAPGEGTQFIVLLPCLNCAEHYPRRLPRPEPYRAPLQLGLVLLLVEDEETLRTPVAHLLRRKGIYVLEAGDGPTAIQLLRREGQAVDAMLLDMTLPGMSGNDVISEVSRIRPDVKIVLTSAYDSHGFRDALASPQVKGFIRKPYEFSELLQVLGRVVEKSPAEAIGTARFTSQPVTRDRESRVP
jgi:two-component system, cell cycle sensor histidine kinase and response regulator CckA